MGVRRARPSDRLKARGDEPLVDLRKQCPGIVIALDAERLKVEKTAYARRTVARMLKHAQSLLPRGHRFIVRDAWRPAYVQADIVFGFIERFRRMHPSWSRRRAEAEAKTYAAPWKGTWASGHMTGGALDVRILDAHGRRLPMRSRTLTYQENAMPDHPRLPERLRKNRELLRRVMTAAGFSNHPLEFWHWSYGDAHWAKREGRSRAFYDVVPDHGRLYRGKPCPCGSGKLFIRCHGT